MTTDTVSLNQLPDIGRPDAGIALISQWNVAAPDRQRAAAEASVAAWERVPWPEDLLSISAYASTDGKTVLTYAQWTSEAAYREYLVTAGLPPDMHRPEPVRYRLYRSKTSDGPRRIPGCIVIINVEFAGPDERRQRQWVDTVFAALDAEPVLHPGGIAGYFHVSTDGISALNYAEWASEEAHQEALENSGQGTVGQGAKWQLVKNFPGVISNGFKRYRLVRSLARP